MDPENPTQEGKDPIFYVGLGLLSVGALALLYLVLSLWGILRAPGDSHLVQWFVAEIGRSEILLDGQFEGKAFEIHASAAFQYVFLGLFALLMVRLLTSIFMSFVVEGSKLMQPPRQRRRE